MTNRTERSKAWKWTVIGYVIALHLLSVALIVKTDFIPKVRVKLEGIYGRFFLESTKKELSSMNRTHLPTTIEGKYNSNYEKSLKILIIGNSLTYHPISESIGWNHASGMAASNINRDYAHLLIKRISETKKVNVDFKISNLADFERGYKTFDYKVVNSLVAFAPDIVVFQLGENVEESSKNIKEFQPYYEKLVSFFQNSKKFITTPFFSSNDKNTMTKDVALLTKSYLVDLSHLVILNNSNYVKSETLYSNAGINGHPGDFGMKNIEEMLFLTMNLVIE